MVTYTNDQIADYLTTGYWQDGGELQRSFDVAPEGTLYVDYSTLSAAGQRLAKLALQAWSDLTGIRFSTATPPVGQSLGITFQDSEEGAYSTSVIVHGTIISAVVNVPQSWVVQYGTGLDGYAYSTFAHELGHALGLGHAGKYNGSAVYGVDNHYSNDSFQASIMSYFSQTENPTISASYANHLTPMIADILAMQDLYGTATNLRLGDTIYGVGSNAGGIYNELSAYFGKTTFTIIDSGGMDTINFSATSADQIVNLNDESYSSVGGLTGNMAIARGTIIENFHSGSGNDQITGNEAENLLRGGAGDDHISGAAGDDVLQGGAGNDTLEGGTENDDIYGEDGQDTLNGGAGNDQLYGGDDDRASTANGASDGGNTVLPTSLGGGSNFGTGTDTISDLLGNFGTATDTAVGLVGGFVTDTGTDTGGGPGGGFVIDTGTDTDGGLGGGSGWGSTVGLFFRPSEGTELIFLSSMDVRDSYRPSSHAFVLDLGGTNVGSFFDGITDNNWLGGSGLTATSTSQTDDRLRGGAGNDILTGGTGADVFIFSASGGEGNDVITDFEDTRDRIEILNGRFADLTIRGADGNTYISWHDTTIELTGIDPSMITADDFIFD